MYVYLYPLVGLVAVLMLGVMGSALPPYLARRWPKLDLLETRLFKWFNGFAAGIIIAVGYVHSLADAQTDLAEVLDYPIAGASAMIGSLLTFIIEHEVETRLQTSSMAHSHDHHNNRNNYEAIPPPEHVQSSQQEKNEPLSLKSLTWPDKVKFYTEMYSLLFGITFHSFFVGFALGLDQQNLGLLVAILLHQFFEGLALGMRIVRAKVRRKAHVFIIDAIFSLAAPLGIAIGVSIQAFLSGATNSSTLNLLKGLFNGFSAGILIYVGLFHMMTEEVNRAGTNRKDQFLIYSGVLLGVAVMSVIAVWA